MATGKNFNKIKKFELKRRHPRKKIIIRKRKFANGKMAKAKNIYNMQRITERRIVHYITIKDHPRRQPVT